MPFTLWPEQIRVMWTVMVMRLVLILKARQLGISWICCSYALWLCLFQPGKVVLIFSKGQDEANEMLQRIKRLYERLPDWFREVLPDLVVDNTKTLEWSNGSRVKSLPATKSAGRSLTASLVILDEAGFLIWASQLFSALKPTIDGGGQIIILSTANGIGNLFHQLWTKATRLAKGSKGGKPKGFTTIFLPWWARPGRTQEWYQEQLEEYTDPEIVKQEYPSSAQEAFLVSGRVRFKATWIQKQTPAEGGLPEEALPASLRDMDGLTVYSLPQPGRRYVIGADVAEGLEDGDFDAATLIDAETWEEVAVLHGKWETDEYAVKLHTLSDVYRAQIAVERNNHGHSVLSTLKLRRCTRVALGPDGRPGWLSTAKSKPQSIDLLATGLRDELVKVKTQAALNEMHIYRVLKNGGTGAPGGYHDDLVMSWAIALMVARQPVVKKGSVSSVSVSTY